MPRAIATGTRIVIASHNPGKVREFGDLLRPFGLDVVSAGALGLPEPDETETTFIGNARLKALAAATASGLPALSDDSGLEVEALDGAPGIYSARWAGPSKDFAIAMQLVHDKLAAAGAWSPPGPRTLSSAPGPRALSSAPGPRALSPAPGPRALSLAPGLRANFTAALCLAFPDGASEAFEGKVFGHLVWPPRGNQGFGYDPMFLPEDGAETFGEMAPDAKHAISHRARAFALLKARFTGG